MAQSKISKKTLQNRPIAPLIFKKISKKTPLYINNKAIKLIFNPDIKGLDKLFEKNEVEEIIKADEFKLTKMFFVGKGGPYKLTDLKEAIDFDSTNQASSYNSKDFHELSELKNTVKQSYLFDDFAIYILLTKEMLGKELNSIFLSMSDYGFSASYITATDSSDLLKYLVKKYSMPHRKADQIANSIVNYAEKKKKKLNELNIDELKKIEPKLTIEILKKFKGEIITQSYDKGDYDTGYFAVWAGRQGADGDAEQYVSKDVSKENDGPFTKMSLEKYNKVLKMLLE